MPTIPLLRDILPGPDSRPPISLSLLAKELNVPVSRLTPLVEQGYLTVDEGLVEAPTQAGLLWLRGWFQPPQAKPLLSQRDIAGLLEIEESAVPSLLAAHDIPTTHDSALGLVVSLWGARRLLLECLSTGPRFDRQALLWFLVGDPSKTTPPFSQQIEDEIQRIAQLEEPARSIRREALLSQWADAKAVAGVEASESVEKSFRRL